MTGKGLSLVLSTVLPLTVLANDFSNVNANESAQLWYEAGASSIEDAQQLRANKHRAKNVILFVGDGMGISTVTAARILEGQLRGESGEENLLSFEKMPYLALSKTYNTNQQTPDSAGTMTAMMSGIKSKAGVISVDQSVTRGDCASSQNAHLKTFLEQAEQAGMSTGVVTTARLTHATPAATYAHTPERNWEDDRDLPLEAKENGCKDIARQLIEFPYGDGIEVAMGGGRRSFWPRNRDDLEDAGKTGEREDGRNLTEEWVAQYDNAAFVWNKDQFDAIDTENIDHLLGLFNRSHMQYNYDLPNDNAGEPSIAEMTTKAINILDNNRKGYFLMVESGRIDHGHHAGNAFRALDDTIAFSNAIKAAMENTDPRDTLIIVTADHSHAFTIAGYPTRGNPILGNVLGNDSSGNPAEISLAKDNMPYTTVSYANGRGFAMLGTGGDTHYAEAINTGRTVDLSFVDTQDQGFHQEALVPLSSETHSAEDVAIYSQGPGAYLFHGVQEQNVIYHVMNTASRIEKRAEHGHDKERRMVRNEWRERED
ncbi:alkaline phosphatase [sulfur-oxidizing endosymbiont of Gigantopelta aegis]|uniref:alkaline phosphatase n=1 Tax=sulfur-oxidizing endosymbiont of Gigantopelta aegis TaxID=2794934 RepID=UPI0018DD23EA